MNRKFAIGLALGFVASLAIAATMVVKVPMIQIDNTTASSLLKNDSGKVVTNAVSGTDYLPPATQIALTHAGTVTLTFAAIQSQADLVLTGAVTFATSNLAAGHNYTVFGRNTQATNCTPTFPAWRWMGGAPSTVTAFKEFAISLSARGTVDTNVWAAYSEAQ